ncbi:MAG TPA: hypothetical protein VNM14_21025 [Planctomycetota bacterium]|jgi:hypothetical protein|nr:hypothetical protein [Planctomycetota bacterium]
MVDRASTFTDDETLELLRKKFIAYAPSVTEMLKAKGPAGDLFRKVVNQRPEPAHTKQGYYLCSPDGTLLKGWMYPRPDDGTMKRYLKEVLASYDAPKNVGAMDTSKADHHAAPLPPEGATVVEVSAKLIDAEWQQTKVERLKMIRGAIGRDRLWITKAEIQELLKGVLPDSLLERVVRYHFIDNTRGVASCWQPASLKELGIQTSRENGKLKVEASVRLEEGDRYFTATLEGIIETKGDVLSRFDLLARGSHSQRTMHVGELPLGESTLAIAFTLAARGESAKVPPLYSYDPWNYLKTEHLRVTDLRKAAKGPRGVEER